MIDQKQTQCKKIINCAKVYEARLKVLDYMQAEDVKKNAGSVELSGLKL